MSKGDYKMYTIKQINQLIDKVRIRPLFQGLPLPNHHCSSFLLNGRDFIKKYGKSSLSYQQHTPVIHSNIVPFEKPSFQNTDNSG